MSTPEPEAPTLHVYTPEAEAEAEPEEPAGPEPTFESEDEDEEPTLIPVLTEEILAKMFANLMAHGVTLGELAG
jgi:hypothetical protein